MEPSVVVAAVAIVIGLLGASIRTAKSHIATRVKLECDEKMDMLGTKIDTAIINIAEVNAAAGRVYALEKQIGNGLEARLRRVETMTAEIHGWQKAQNGGT